MSLGLPLAVVVAVLVVVLGRREWSKRALLLGLPALVVIVATLQALLEGRTALLALLEAPDAALAVATLQAVPAMEAQGLQAAAAAYLVLACSELAPRPGSERTGLGWAALGLGAVATAAVGWAWARAGGSGPVGWAVIAGTAVSTLAASVGAGFSLRGEDGIARAMTGAFAMIAAFTALYLAAGQDWVAAGFAAAPDLAGRSVNVAWMAGIAATVLGLVGLLARRFWEHGDRFAIELVLGLLATGSALIFHMPVNFLQDRVLPYTEGGQVVVLERRLLELPVGEGVPVDENVLMVVDRNAFDSRTGRPVESTSGALVALRPDANASDLNGDEKGLILLPPDQPEHPANKSIAARPLVWTDRGVALDGTIDELLGVCGDPCAVQPPVEAAPSGE